MPAATRPSAPSAASTPPVGSSSSATQQGEGDQGDDDEGFHRLDYPLSQSRVARNVGCPVRSRLVGVLALLEEDELAGAVVEGGVGEAAAAPSVGDLFVGVGVARVGDGRLARKVAAASSESSELTPRKATCLP